MPPHQTIALLGASPRPRQFAKNITLSATGLQNALVRWQEQEKANFDATLLNSRGQEIARNIHRDRHVLIHANTSILSFESNAAPTASTTACSVSHPVPPVEANVPRRHSRDKKELGNNAKAAATAPTSPADLENQPPNAVPSKKPGPKEAAPTAAPAGPSGKARASIKGRAGSAAAAAAALAAATAAVEAIEAAEAQPIEAEGARAPATTAAAESSDGHGSKSRPATRSSKASATRRNPFAAALTKKAADAKGGEPGRATRQRTNTL